MSSKITSAIIILTMFFASSAKAVYAKKADVNTWQSYVNGSASVDEVEGGMMLNVDTKANESGVARTKYSLRADGDSIYFSVTFSTGSTPASGFYPDRTVYIAPDTDDVSVVKKAAVLMCISGQSLLGGADYTDMGASVSAGDKHTLCAAVSRGNNSVEIWLDGSYVGKTSISLSADHDTEELCLIFENTYPVNKKNARASQFTLYDVCSSVTAIPDAFAETEDCKNYTVEMGTVAYSAQISIAGAGSYTYEFIGGGFNVTFSEPLDENTEYAVTLTDIKALDGNVYSAACVLNKRQYKFSLPQKERYGADELSDYAVETQDGIEKVSYYVDGEYFKSTSTPFAIDLSALAYGIHTVAASAVTEKGELLTDKKEITVVNKIIDTKVDYDFENVDDGELTVNTGSRVIGANDLYSNVTGDGKYMACGEVEGHTKAFMYGCNNAASASTPFVAACMTASGTVVLFDTDILFFDTEAKTTLVARGANSSGETVFPGNISFEPAGEKMEVYAYNGNISSKIAELDINKWYTISYELDLVNQTYSFYLDGERIVDSYRTNIEITMLNNMIRFNTTYKAGVTSKIALDNVRLSTVNESMCLKPSEFDRGAKTVTISQTGVQGEITKAPVVIKDGHEIEIAAWRQSGRSLIIDFENALMQTGRYDISVETRQADKPTASYFTVAGNEADVEDISVFGADGKCMAVFTQTEKAGGEELIFIVNRYSGGKLVRTYIEKTAGQNVSVGGIEYENGDLIKAFVLKQSLETVPFSDITAQTVLYVN